jgi:hypothetical protein
VRVDDRADFSSSAALGMTAGPAMVVIRAGPSR